MRSPIISNFNTKFLFVITAVLVGIVSVLYGKIFIFSIQLAQERILENPNINFLITPLFFVIGAYICLRFAPNASGSGHKNVMTVLDNLDVEKYDLSKQDQIIKENLSFRIIIAKILSSISCCFAGGALGKEGPIIQISASIFVVILQKFKLPIIEIKNWIMAGRAAGIAAAFNTPLAGITYAIETIIKPHFSSFRTYIILAVVIAGLVAQLLTGSYILFYFTSLNFVWNSKTFAAIVLIAIISGVLGWLLKFIINIISTKFSTMSNFARYLLIPITMGLLVVIVSLKVRNHSFGSGLLDIQHLLSLPHNEFIIKHLLGRYINTVASYLSGCAGGLLLPSLALGADVGYYVSGLVSVGQDEVRLFIALGMAAFLSSVLKTPLTAAVIVLETTNQRELVLPLLFVTLLSLLVHNWLNCKTHKSL